MDAYVIIGNANTRKSSVLRSLTGCFNRSIRQIQPATGAVLDVYARVSSLQESETTPNDFVKEVTGANVPCVAFCLWPHPNPKDPAAYPDAQAYIKTFIAAGWQIKRCAVIGVSNVSNLGVQVQHFTGVPALPINRGAEQVRKYFGW